MQWKFVFTVVVVHLLTMTSPRVTHYNFNIKKCDHIIGLSTLTQVKICAIITAPVSTTTVATTTVCKPSLSLGTLYQLYQQFFLDYFYTASISAANNATTKYNFELQISPGKVAISANDCLCGMTLKPVIQLYKEFEEHFYTTDELEVLSFVSNGYVREETAFYCSDQPNFCGATLPLYRYLRPNGKHFYATDTAEARGVLEGITCYIWPS